MSFVSWVGQEEVKGKCLMHIQLKEEKNRAGIVIEFSYLAIDNSTPALRNNALSWFLRAPLCSTQRSQLPSEPERSGDVRADTALCQDTDS